MAFHMLQRRWKTRPFAILEADDRASAVEQAARTGVDLSYADLRLLDARGRFLPEVDLRGADLTGAVMAEGYFRKADFRSAVLAGADFRNSRIRDADFRYSDLRNATFSGADVRGVRLAGANMEGTTVDWKWSGFAFELLSRDPGCRGEALRLLSDLAFDEETRPFGWFHTLFRHAGPALEWALEVLGRAVAPTDNAPDLLRRLTADAVVRSSGPAAPERHWTRRRRPA